jgi:SAM-dependent methyltransferase
MRCPLCRSSSTALHAEVHGRRYRECTVCDFVFVAREDLPGREAERRHYLTHENAPTDPGYRAFLDRLARPLVERLPAGASGLDYGCGPGPALAAMLEERGFRMRLWDPFFAPDASVLQDEYDFVTCTETAEHFHSPAEEFDRLDALMKPGGWLGLMTETRRADRPLAGWRYARDPTHVALYNERTMEWIAADRRWEMDSPRAGVFLFHKPAAPSHQSSIDGREKTDGHP